MKRKNIEKREVIMFNTDFCKEHRWLMKKNRNASSILSLIIQSMDIDNCFTCTDIDIQNNIGISTKVIKLATKVLEDNGFIHSIKNETSTTYVVNPSFALDPQMLDKEFTLYPSFENLNTLRTREGIKEPNIIDIATISHIK
jgi:predicted transcriptional regulator